MPQLRLPTTYRGVTAILSGGIVGQALVMLSYPLLTRLYDAAEFGLLTVFSAVVGMVGVVSSASLHRAIPVASDDTEAADVAWAGFIAVLLTATVTALVGLVAGPSLAAQLGVPGLAGYWWLVALTVLVAGAYLVSSSWMVRSRSYAAIGRRNLLLGIGQSATQIGLGLLRVGPIGLLLGYGVGRAVALGGLMSSGGLVRQPRPTPARLRAVLRRFHKFPLLTTPSALLNTAGLEVPLVLISALYGDARAGLLGLTVRVFAAPTVTVGMAVAQVFVGESSAAVRERSGTLAPLLRYTVGRLLLIGTLPAAVLVAFGPGLFGMVFGQEWVESGEYARYLAVAYLAQFAVIPVSGVMQFVERQGQSLGWAAFRLLLTAGGTAVCGLLGAPMLAAVAVLSVSHVVSYALLYVLSLRTARAFDAGDRGRHTEGRTA